MPNIDRDDENATRYEPPVTLDEQIEHQRIYAESTAQWLAANPESANAQKECARDAAILTSLRKLKEIREMKDVPEPVARNNGVEPDPDGAFVYYSDYAEVLDLLAAAQSDLRYERDRNLQKVTEANDARRVAESRLAKVMEAADAVIKRWETPLWKDAPATANYIYALRDAMSAALLSEVGKTTQERQDK